jgi:ribosomal protein S18 acetylase RimI-like enzyme
VRVRAATPADLPALVAMWRALGDESSRTPYGPTRFEELAPAGRSVLDEYLALVADDGAVCGCVLASLVRSDVGYVFGLYVRAPARRRGVGRELLRAAAAALAERGAVWLLLDVDGGNEQAAGFYEALGFREAGRRLTVEVDRLL